jgi:hypothetical protein
MFLETSSYPSYHRTYSMNKFPNMTSEVYVPASTKCIEVVDSYFYNDIHIDLKSNYILNGYWQSEEYLLRRYY